MIPRKKPAKQKVVRNWRGIKVYEMVGRRSKAKRRCQQLVGGR